MYLYVDGAVFLAKSEIEDPWKITMNISKCSNFQLIVPIFLKVLLFR